MRRVRGLAAQNGVGIEGRKGVPFFPSGSREPNSNRPGGLIEGFDVRDCRDCHKGTEQKDYKIVGVKLRGRQVDERRNADGKDAEYAEDGGSDPDEPHHGGLDV
jgi:hypothetical protein